MRKNTLLHKLLAKSESVDTSAWSNSNFRDNGFFLLRWISDEYCQWEKEDIFLFSYKTNFFSSNWTFLSCHWYYLISLTTFNSSFYHKFRNVDFECTYNFEHSLNDANIFSFKIKLIIVSIFRAFQIYNLLLNVSYFLI